MADFRQTAIVMACLVLCVAWASPISWKEKAAAWTARAPPRFVNGNANGKFFCSMFPVDISDAINYTLKIFFADWQARKHLW